MVRVCKVKIKWFILGKIKVFNTITFSSVINFLDFHCLIIYKWLFNFQKISFIVKSGILCKLPENVNASRSKVVLFQVSFHLELWKHLLMFFIAYPDHFCFSEVNFKTRIIAKLSNFTVISFKDSSDLYVTRKVSSAYFRFYILLNLLVFL